MDELSGKRSNMENLPIDFNSYIWPLIVAVNVNEWIWILILKKSLVIFKMSKSILIRVSYLGLWQPSSGRVRE